jgi:hypothetical protein
MEPARSSARCVASSASDTRFAASLSARWRVSRAAALASSVIRRASSSAFCWISAALRSAASTIVRTWSAAAVASDAVDGFCWRLRSETASASSRR